MTFHDKLFDYFFFFFPKSNLICLIDGVAHANRNVKESKKRKKKKEIRQKTEGDLNR